MKQKPFWKWAGLVVLICLTLSALAPASVGALEKRSGDTVVIAAGEVIEDDLVVAAGEFTLNGRVKGDLLVVGGAIEINGVVEGDLWAAGQIVVVNGVVEDDARIAGQALTLGTGAQVADDLMAVGYSLENRDGSSVGGSLMYAGYQALLAGEVAEDAAVAAGGLELSGRVGGNVEAEVGEPGEGPPFSPLMFMPDAPPMPSVSMGLTVGEGATIGGDLDYTSATEFSIPAGVAAGKVTRHEPVVEVGEEEVVSPAMQVTNWLLDHVRRLVALLVVGLLMVWAIPAWTKRVGDVVQAKPLPSLGWGVVTIAAVCLAFLVILVAMILLAVVLGILTLDNLGGTVVVLGLLAIFALAVLFGLTVAYVTKIAVSFLGGRLILAQLNPNWAEGRIWPLVMGVVIFVIVTAIPCLGGLIGLIVVLLGLGALWLLGREAFQQRGEALVTGEA